VAVDESQLVNHSIFKNGVVGICGDISLLLLVSRCFEQLSDVVNEAKCSLLTYKMVSSAKSQPMF